MAENFIAANSPRPRVCLGGWTRPRTGYVKLNVDAAFDWDLLQGAMGAIIRDDRGHMVVAGNKLIDYCYDVLTVEALALKFGLNTVLTAGCNRLIVNSDNLELMEIMNKDGQYAGDAAAIVDDCYHLACEFSSIVFEFCPRESNGVAHELARIARSSLF